jgi:RNA polymerase sigma factor (sigma-70 family)
MGAWRPPFRIAGSKASPCDIFLSDSPLQRAFINEVEMTDSQTLLAEFVRNGSETAFQELVARYVDLVHSTALRLVAGDTHLAEDVAQVVFMDLARKARSLPKDVLLGGWLHRDTCFVAGKTMRGHRRRQAREQQAVEMNALHQNSESHLAYLAPILDDAINQLGEADRTAILLRFFENRDFRSVGQALGRSEDTAQKRVSRALEKLNSLLKHRGVNLSATALSAVLAADAVTAAPAGLAVAISTAALANTATSAAFSLTLLKALVMTNLKFSLLAALAVAVLTVPVALRLTHASPDENAMVTQTKTSNDLKEPSVTAEPNPRSLLPSRRPLRGAQNPAAAPVADNPSFGPMDEIVKGQTLSAEQVQALESMLAQDPQALSARCQLLGYYFTHQSTSGTAREARQRHVLWFIQNHPEMNLGGYALLNPVQDGSAYSQAKALWLQQVSANPQTPAILANAAGFNLIFDRPMAEDLLKQAQTLEPANPAWPEQLAHLYALDGISTKPDAATPSAAKALEQMESAQANTTGEMQKFHNLNKLAQMAFDAGQLEKAQSYAASLLQQTAQPQIGWDYGDAIYRGNLVLGRIALRAGKLDEAKQYLLASAKTTGSPVLGSFGPNMTLARELLDHGEKDSVLEFLGLCTNFWKTDKLAAWTAQVNQGSMPDFGANLNY